MMRECCKCWAWLVNVPALGPVCTVVCCRDIKGAVCAGVGLGAPQAPLVAGVLIPGATHRVSDKIKARIRRRFTVSDLVGRYLLGLSIEAV